MKNTLKKILPCLLVIVSLFTITGCKKTKNTYPSQVPNLSEEFAKETFVTIDGMNITNGNIYYHLLQSYGMNIIEQVMDEKLLADVTLTDEQKELFDEKMNNLIYKTDNPDELTEEEKADLFEDFKIEMISDGLLVEDADKDNPLYYMNYQLLEFKRLVKTLEVLKQEIKEFNEKADKNAAEAGTDPVYYYKAEDYLNFFVDNFHKTHDLIVVTFDSQKQALEALAKAGVNTANLSGEWTKASSDEKFTKEELVEVFKDLYKTAYGKDCEGAKTYFYEDLVKIATSSTPDRIIAQRATSLNANDLAKSYTHGPLSYNGRWYAMISLADSDEYFYDEDHEVKYEDKLVEEKDEMLKPTKISKELEEKLFDELVYVKLTGNATTYQNQIDRVMFEIRQDAGLEIYAEGLEIAYKNAYNAAFSALKITDNDKFFETKNVSDKVVFKWNDGEITNEQMFGKLTERYGALITLLYLQQHVVLASKYNEVVNYKTGEILDQKKYDEYFKKDIKSYKESFEKGSFASYGFPASYGWENFLRDYIGITDEAQAIIDFNSTLYTDVLDIYTKSIYEAEVSEITLTVKPSGNSDIKGNTWWMSSPKWADEHDTEITVADENEKPEILLVYSKDDFTLREEDKDMDINDYYGHYVLRTKTGDFVTKVAVDEAIHEEYMNIFKDTFSANATGVRAYYDVDLDGTEDELEEGTPEADLAKALVEEIWEEVEAKKKNDGTKTIYTYLNEVIREYETSSINSSWNQYRTAGLRLTTFENNSYNRSSEIGDGLKTYIFNMWTEINEYKNHKDKEGEDGVVIGTTITGQSLDPGYRYVKNSQAYYVTALDFVHDKGAIYEDNGYMKLAITKATAKTTEYYYTTSNGVEKNIQHVTKYLYDQYLLDSSDRDATVNCTAQISSYYAAAISNLASEKIVNTKLMNACKDLLAKTTFTNNNDKFIETLTILIDAGIKKNAPEE